MVGKNLGESVGASGVHQVSQLNILGTELFLILHVNIGEVSLADLSCQRIQFGVEVRNNRKYAGKFVVNKVVIILPVVEGVQSQSVEECSLVLGLSNNEGNHGELALDKNIFWTVQQNFAIDTGSEPTGEGPEHKHLLTGRDDFLLRFPLETVDDVLARVSGTLQPGGQF